METFVKLFKIEGGFDPCENNSIELEEGIEKVALYVDSSNEVSHAARQKENGTWASKLGDLEDIEHKKLDALYGDAPTYGTLAKILKRSRIKKVSPITSS